MPSKARALASGMILMLAIFQTGCEKPTQVYVECTGVIGGMSCTAEHRQGTESVRATWDVLIGCRNGVQATVTAWQDVQPNAKVGRFIPWNDVANFQNCDQVATSQVSNLRLVPHK